jgi:hypothetical protein
MISSPRHREGAAAGDPARSWVGNGLVAAGRGAALTGLMLAEAGVLVALAIAWLSVPLGVAMAAIGLWSGPRLLTWHSRLARGLLAPASALRGQPVPA